jgi:cobyrinic acid a,c-diamide synthase
MVAVPRLVIAAPASGSGKTTVACGLMAALRARGLAVSGHKAGPDYIDPGYHALATGRPARNLDPFLCGEQRIVPLFRHGARGADVAVVEGVMGLFDGTQPRSGEGAGDPGFGSTAHVARLLAAPVVLVVDASSAGRSVAALATGFARFDPRTTVAGVILNRVASDRHERLLREALAAAGLPVYGAIRRSDSVAAPSRHLGLIPAAERSAAAVQALDRLATLAEESCDLPGLLSLARTAPPLPGPAWDPAEVIAASPAVTAPGSLPGRAGAPDAVAPVRAASRPVVAMAGGAAFTFSYSEHAELLAAAGLDVAVFDPLRDERLPEGTAGLVLGGGFPEVHAADLSANERLRHEVAAAAARGVPVAAECAGLLYLARTLDGLPMCGVLPAAATMTGRLTLGYREARAEPDSVLAAAGDVVRAHEFHRTATVPEHGARAAWQIPAGAGAGEGAGAADGAGQVGPRREGHVAGAVHASYLHTHWAGSPGAAARFAAACHAAGHTTGGTLTVGSAR